jgi:two-component system chemotaxis sensor kinase CheA
VEAHELLDGLTQGILRIEKGEGGQDQIGSLLRLAHTLKGASRVVKQPAIAERAHAMEGILVRYREGQAAVSEDHVSELLRLADGINTGLAALQPEAEPSAAAPAGAACEEDLDTVRVDMKEVDAVLNSLSEASVQFTAIRQEAETVQQAKRMASLLGQQLRPRGREQNESALPRAGALAEELSGSLERLARGLTVRLEQAERELAQAREFAIHLRLLPTATILPSLARAARDAAAALGKRVELCPAGGARLDAHILMVLRDALLHLVRNAVAHGIETEEQRIAAGKPPAGRIEIQVQRRGSRVAFVCRDDGRGMDLEEIRRVAVKKGVISASQADVLQLGEAIELLVRGGVSTTGTPTQVSGRGIGLDVVREAAARLKGDLSIQTIPGQGTTVEVSVPVSLASVQAITVEAAGCVAAIPLDSVRRVLRVAEAEMAHSGSNESIGYDGEAIPFLPLAEAVEWQPASAATHRGGWSVVVVSAGAALAAVGVDRLLGSGIVLVRSLPALAAAKPVVAGVSLDAEGNPQLVLDPAGLVETARGNRVRPSSSGWAARPPILVIDDSLTTRMLEQSILESAGYQVELATSAEEALEKARARRYSLFLVDIEMPGMNGFEFIARAREDPVLRDIPSILVTSRNSAEDQRRGEQAGAQAYIFKGEFDQGVLLQTIRRLEGRR